MLNIFFAAIRIQIKNPAFTVHKPVVYVKFFRRIDEMLNIYSHTEKIPAFTVHKPIVYVKQNAGILNLFNIRLRGPLSERQILNGPGKAAP